MAQQIGIDLVVRMALAAVCVRRVRRPDFLTIENSLSPGHPRPGILLGVSTYRTVQISEATSARDSTNVGKKACCSLI
jgi:hypothetical protein